MKRTIEHLLLLDEKNNGKKSTDHELKRLYHWVYEECRLRWPHVTKREVWEEIQLCQKK